MRNLLVAFALGLALFAGYTHARTVCEDQFSDAAIQDALESLGLDGAPPEATRMFENAVLAQVSEECRDPAVILRALRYKGDTQ